MKRWERLTWAVFRAARLADGRLLFTEASSTAHLACHRSAALLSLAAMASLRGRGKSGGRAGAGGGGRGRGNAAKDDETFGGGDEKSDEPCFDAAQAEGYLTKAFESSLNLASQPGDDDMKPKIFEGKSSWAAAGAAPNAEAFAKAVVAQLAALPKKEAS